VLAFLPGLQPGAISAKGFGGDITVASGGDVLASQGANALTEFTATGSKPGTIKVESPEVDLTGELAPLVSAIIQSGATLAPTCGMRLYGDQSSFTLEGSNGLPPDPGAEQPSGPKATTQPAGR
jgi:hypothetical protein